MKKLLVAALLAALSSCASAPAVAACATAAEAAAFVKANGLTPFILRGTRMRPFVELAESQGSTGLQFVDFVAILFTPSGEALMFFGNVKTVCGPVTVEREFIMKHLRPA